MQSTTYQPENPGLYNHSINTNNGPNNGMAAQYPAQGGMMDQTTMQNTVQNQQIGQGAPAQGGITQHPNEMGQMGGSGNGMGNNSVGFAQQQPPQSMGMNGQQQQQQQQQPMHAGSMGSTGYPQSQMGSMDNGNAPAYTGNHQMQGSLGHEKQLSMGGNEKQGILMNGAGGGMGNGNGMQGQGQGQGGVMGQDMVTSPTHQSTQDSGVMRQGSVISNGTGGAEGAMAGGALVGAEGANLDRHATAHKRAATAEENMTVASKAKVTKEESECSDGL